MNDEHTDEATVQGGKPEGSSEVLPLAIGTSTNQEQSESTLMMQQPQRDLSQPLPVVEGESPTIPVSGALHVQPLEDMPPNASCLSTVEQEIQQTPPNYQNLESAGLDAILQRSMVTNDFIAGDNLDVQSAMISRLQQNISDQDIIDHQPELQAETNSLATGAVVQPIEHSDDVKEITDPSLVGAQGVIAKQEVAHQPLPSQASTELNDDADSWGSWGSSPDAEETDKLGTTRPFEPQHSPAEQALDIPHSSRQNEEESQLIDSIGVSPPRNVLVVDKVHTTSLQVTNTPKINMQVQPSPQHVAAPHRSNSATLSSTVETEPLIPTSLLSSTEGVSEPAVPSTTSAIPSTILTTERKHVTKNSRRNSRRTTVEDHTEEFPQSDARKRHRSPPRVLGMLLITMILAFGSIAYSQVRLLKSTKNTKHRRDGSQTKAIEKSKVRRHDMSWVKRLGSSASPPKREEHVFQKVHRKDKPTDPPIIVVGLPKAGTSSLFQYFNCFGYWSQHWYCCGRQMNAQNPGPGQTQMMSDCIANNLAKNLSMFDGCGDFEVYAEINGPRRDPKTNKLWGNVHPRILLPQHYYLPQLYDAAPNATWILNLRPVKDWIASVASIPGNTLALQFFNEGKAQEPKRWKGKFADKKFLEAFWDVHVKRVREFAMSHPTIRFIEIDITDENAGMKLAQQMEWFGNNTTQNVFPKAGALSTKNGTSPETIKAWADKCWGAHNVKQHADYKGTKKTSKK